MGDNIVTIKEVSKSFRVKGKGLFGRAHGQKAVDRVSFGIQRGETYGLVGESGCGKSTLARMITGLCPPTSGEIYYEGTRIDCLSNKERRPYFRKMQMIFQDPYASLNPRFTVGEVIEEPLVSNRLFDKTMRRKKTAEIIERVGLASDTVNRYPHEFSGGQRQRIGIARALILEPEFIVCDEPISALDVSIQAQIMNLLEEIQRERGISYLFIAHDLGMVKHISNTIGVMYLGHLVEAGETEAIYEDPWHPYTKALLSAVPAADPKRARKKKRILLPGEETADNISKEQCPFAAQCKYAFKRCRQESPGTYYFGKRSVSCFLYSEQSARKRDRNYRMTSQI